MNNKNLIIILLTAYLATFFRLYIDNFLIVSIIGSFVYGFVIARNISNSKKEILLVGFCSCFTSYSGFLFYLYELFNQGYYLKLFLYLNLIVIFNLIIIYFGLLIGRKMN